ncbi:MAG: STAS domain-containing protein [Planctomycetota bacterium]
MPESEPQSGEVAVEIPEARLDEWFEQGREALRDGQITKAHQVFGQVAAVHPAYPLLGHAMACSLANSFLVKPEGQIDARNAPLVRERFNALRTEYRDVRLLLIDFASNSYLTSPGIDVLVELQKWPHVIVKLIEVHPRPAQILKTLKMDHLLWDDYSCPICGPDRACPSRFARRRRFSIALT